MAFSPPCGYFVGAGCTRIFLSIKTASDMTANASGLLRSITITPSACGNSVSMTFRPVTISLARFLMSWSSQVIYGSHSAPLTMT